MKKLTAFILSFVLMLMLCGCNTAENPPTENIINGKDMTWWEENCNKNIINAVLSCGINYAFTDVTASEIIDLYKKIETAEEITVTQLTRSYYDYSYGMSLLSKTDDTHYLQAYFICDFKYVVLYPDGENTPHIYCLSNGEEIKQFFVEKEMCIAPDQWENMLDLTEDYLRNASVEEINATTLSGLYNQPKADIPADYVLKYTDSTSLGRKYSSGAAAVVYEMYKAAVFGPADSDSENRVYSFRFEIAYDGPQPAIIQKYIVDNGITDYKPDSYTLADMDYTLWRDKIGNCEYNGYTIEPGIRTNGHGYSAWSGAPDFNSDFMYCLDTLQLGEIADVNKADYKLSPVYTLTLQKDSRSPDIEKLFTVYFYEDCKYASVCDCDGWTSRNDCSVHPVYTVENPQMVQETLKKHYKYIPYADYTEIADYAEKYITEKTEKLTEKNVTDIEIHSGAELSPVMNRVEISPYKDYENPESDEYYRVELPLWYFDLENDIHTEYHLNMIVRKTFFGWKTTWVEIYENMPESYIA
ncbi:MAG: hypothetical protein IJ410_04375 [Oscillospiraceae bacterium]|nr:hypothetical protein [Oscillospiraceae bacterium]